MPIDIQNLRDRLLGDRDTGRHPNFPGRGATFDGSKPLPQGELLGDPWLDIPPDEDPQPQTDLTRRSVINRLQEPIRSELRATVAGIGSTIPILLGKFRTPGKLTYVHAEGGNWFWIYCFGEKINEPLTVMFNGKAHTSKVSLGGGGWSFSLVNGATFYVYDGTQTVVPTVLAALQQLPGGSYTDTHEGFCFGFLAATNSQLEDVPAVELIGEGSPDVWDPRLSGGSGDTAYTTTPALHLAYLYDNYTDMTVDWTTVTPVANSNEVTDDVTSQKYTELGIAIHRQDDLDAWAAVVREYAYCHVVSNGDTVRFINDIDRSPVMTLGNQDIPFEGTQWTRGSLSETPDQVQVSWIDPDTGQRDFEYSVDGDPGDRLESYDMPGFLHPIQAYNYAVRRYNKMKIRDLSTTLLIGAAGIALDFGDVVLVNDGRIDGIQQKQMELLEIEQGDAGEYVARAIEFQPSVYAATPQDLPTLADTIFPDPSDITTVTLTVTATSTYDVNLGSVVINVSWDEPDFLHVDGYYVVLTDLDSDPDRIDVEADIADRTQVTFSANGLVGATQYEVAVTPYNSIASGTPQTINHTTADDQNAPAVATGLTITKINGTDNFWISFDNPQDKDIEYWQADSDYRTISGPGAWSGLFGTQFWQYNPSGPLLFKGGANYVALHEGRVRIRAIDRSGNFGDYTAWSDIFTLGPFDEAVAATKLDNDSGVTGSTIAAALDDLDSRVTAGGGVAAFLKCKGNLSSASFDDTENDLVWATPTIQTGSASTDLSISGSEITINTAGTYRFTVTLRTDNSNRTELFIRTYIDTGSGFTQDTDEIVSDYVSRDNDQDTGSVTLDTALTLAATDKVEFRGFGDTDGTSVGLDAGTILLIDRLA